MSSDSAPFADGNYDPFEALEAADKFSTADILDIEADESEPPEEVWGGLRLAPGQLMEVIGGSGLGKSRMMVNLAINQVLGRDFAGLPTCKRPLKWVFFGNENGYYRYRTDARMMLKFCNSAQREQIRNHIFLPTLKRPMDAHVSLSDEKNRIKFKMTIRYRDADVAVFDPWGAVIDGDELDDGDVRKTIFEIMDILTANVKKPTVGIILNHSRNGIKEIADAAGFGAANYGKNSKAIFTVMRNVWNLRPGHFAEPTTKIELIHAKCSDFQPYPPRAVDFDPRTFTYDLDPAFDHMAWQSELEIAKRKGSSLTPTQRNDALIRQDEEQRRKIKEYVASKGPLPKTELVAWMRKQGISINRAQILYSSMLKSGDLAKVTEHLTSRVVVGIPSDIIKLHTNAPFGTYRTSPPSCPLIPPHAPLMRSPLMS